MSLVFNSCIRQDKIVSPFRQFHVTPFFLILLFFIRVAIKSLKKRPFLLFEFHRGRLFYKQGETRVRSPHFMMLISHLSYSFRVPCTAWAHDRSWLVNSKQWCYGGWGGDCPLLFSPPFPQQLPPSCRIIHGCVPLQSLEWCLTHLGHAIGCSLGVCSVGVSYAAAK